MVNCALVIAEFVETQIIDQKHTASETEEKNKAIWCRGTFPRIKSPN